MGSRARKSRTSRTVIPGNSSPREIAGDSPDDQAARCLETTPRGVHLWDVAVAIMKALQVYAHPLVRPSGSLDARNGIEEIDESGAVIDDHHMLNIMMRELVRCSPHGVCSMEVLDLFSSLRENSAKDPSRARRDAERLHDWFRRSMGPFDRMAFLDPSLAGSNVVILDEADRFVDVDDRGYRILKYLYSRMNSGYAPWHEISKEVLDCEVDERTVNNHIKTLPPELRDLVKKKSGKGRYLVLP